MSYNKLIVFFFLLFSISLFAQKKEKIRIIRLEDDTEDTNAVYKPIELDINKTSKNLSDSVFMFLKYKQTYKLEGLLPKWNVFKHAMDSNARGNELIVLKAKYKSLYFGIRKDYKRINKSFKKQNINYNKLVLDTAIFNVLIDDRYNKTYSYTYLDCTSGKKKIRFKYLSMELHAMWFLMDELMIESIEDIKKKK